VTTSRICAHICWRRTTNRGGAEAGETACDPHSPSEWIDRVKDSPTFSVVLEPLPASADNIIACYFRTRTTSPVAAACTIMTNAIKTQRYDNTLRQASCTAYRTIVLCRGGALAAGERVCRISSHDRVRFFGRDFRNSREFYEIINAHHLVRRETFLITSLNIPTSLEECDCWTAFLANRNKNFLNAKLAKTVMILSQNLEVRYLRL